MDGPLFERPYRGVRAWAPADSLDPRWRATSAGLLVPDGGAVGGWAAAATHGFPWTDGLDWSGEPLPVVVVLPRPAQIRVRRGLRVVRGRLDPGDVVEVAGIAVTSPARTAFDLLRWAPDPGRALAWADAALRSGSVSHEDLLELIAARRGWPGVRQAARVAWLADAGAESPQESRFRWVWVSVTGVVPLVNPDVYVEGNFLGRFDVLDEEAGVAGEYDGERHGRAGQRAYDLGRDQRSESGGLIVVRAAANALDPTDAKARGLVRRGYTLALERRLPRRWSVRRRRAA